MSRLSHVAWTVTLLAAALNLYIYTYPSLDPQNCSWSRRYINYENLSDRERQIVGIPYLGDLYVRYFVKEDPLLAPEVDDLRLMAVGDPQINGNWPKTPYIKRLDNLGNDYYIGHIYRVMESRLRPSHVAVMGDMFSSQWIADSEFYNRTRRFVTRLFDRPANQVAAQMAVINKHEDGDWMAYFNEFNQNLGSGSYDTADPYQYKDVWDWTQPGVREQRSGPLFINMTGNHDIGYGDTTYQHMSRWRVLFGKENYWIEYDTETDHPWRIVVVNSLALDGPLLQPEFQTYSWKFIDTLAKHEFDGTTILMTHIPMFKREGLCADGPYVDYFNKSNCPPGVNCHMGLLKSENHLQYETSQRILNAAFRNNKGGIIMTGHDHVGCLNYYNYDAANQTWTADKTIKSDKFIREITVRSVMGEFEGNIGIVTGHFNSSAAKWDFDYSTCPFQVQHVWWAAQILILLSILLQTASIFM